MSEQNTTVAGAIDQINKKNEIRDTWKSEAGPIQSKKVREALRGITVEGQTHTEKWGVLGVDEHEQSFFSPFGGCRQEAGEMMGKIGDAFGWLVTRDNYQQIITECGKAIEELKKTRPVTSDTRVTPEQHAIDEAARQENEAKREQERAAAAAQRQQEARQRQDQQPATILEEGIIIRRNLAKNGIEIRFAKKPSEFVLTRIKDHHWRWFGPSKLWYTKFSPEQWTFIHELVGQKAPAIPAEVVPDRFDMAAEDRMATACGLV